MKMFQAERGWDVDEPHGYMDNILQGNFPLKEQTSHRIRTLSMPKLTRTSPSTSHQRKPTLNVTFSSKTNLKFKFNFTDESSKKEMQLTSVSPTKFSLVKKKKNMKYNVINMSQLLVQSPKRQHQEQLNKVLKRFYQKK